MTGVATTQLTDGESKVAIEDVLPAAFRLNVSGYVLAALGARLGSDPDAIPPEIAAAIDEVLAAAGIPSVVDLAPQQRAMAAGMVRTMFGQAADLLAAPERPPGWAYTDVAVLEGQGRGSMVVPSVLAQTGAFGEVTSFLDVGTGVGWLIVAAAEIWPNATFVGIDIYERALERARQNVAGAGVAGRVELRRQSVTDLADQDRFDLTWFPSFFIRGDLLPPAFEKVLAATRPDGHIAVGCYEAPDDRLARATGRLRTLRDGGSVLEEREVIELLEAAGWQDVRALPRRDRSPLGVVAGRKEKG